MVETRRINRHRRTLTQVTRGVAPRPQKRGRGHVLRSAAAAAAAAAATGGSANSSAVPSEEIHQTRKRSRTPEREPDGVSVNATKMPSEENGTTKKDRPQTCEPNGGTSRAISEEATCHQKRPTYASSSAGSKKEHVGGVERPINISDSDDDATKAMKKATSLFREISVIVGGSAAGTSQPGFTEAVGSDVPPEFQVLYQKIAACYGGLNGDMSSKLRRTLAVLTKQLLKTISEMMNTKPDELSIVAVSQWEMTVRIAAGADYNVGWLIDILAKMRDFINGDGAMGELEHKANVVTTLLNEVAFARKQLNQALQLVESLKKEVSDTSNSLEAACLELEKLKDRQVCTNFFKDFEQCM